MNVNYDDSTNYSTESLQDHITTSRDCDALLIPSATPILIPAGSEVKIMQNLGGTYTVSINGNLARIEAEDADVLGVSSEQEKSSENNKENKIIKEASGPVDLDSIWKAMSDCYDPEIPVNIVDLGLIYDCSVDSSPDYKKNHVHILMTLTAPGCGMGPIIAQDVENKVLDVENVTSVNVELVFEPQWTQDMMSEAAQLELGLL